MDIGQVADIDPKIALPHIEAGNLERVTEREFATLPPAERAIDPPTPAPDPPTPKPPKDGLQPWPPNKRIKKSPAEYLLAAPDGRWAELARQHVGG